MTAAPKPPPDTSWITMTEISEGRPSGDHAERRLRWLLVFLGGAAFGVLLSLAAVWVFG